MSESVLLPQLTLLMGNSLADCIFLKKDFLQIIRNTDLNKAPGHDVISIRILKLFRHSMCQSLGIVFKA